MSEFVSTSATASLSFKDPDGKEVLNGSHVEEAIPTSTQDGKIVVQLKFNHDKKLLSDDRYKSEGFHRLEALILFFYCLISVIKKLKFVNSAFPYLCKIQHVYIIINHFAP